MWASSLHIQAGRVDPSRLKNVMYKPRYAVTQQVVIGSGCPSRCCGHGTWIGGQRIGGSGGLIPHTQMAGIRD